MKIDYTTLKHNDDSYTTWDGFLGPMLKVSLEKKHWTRRDLIEATLASINYPSEMLEYKYEKSKDNVLANHAKFALSDLTIAGLLDRPSRGQYEVTALGRKLYEEYGINITRAVTHSQSKFLEHDRRKKEKKQKSSETYKSDTDMKTKGIDKVQVNDWFTEKSRQSKRSVVRKYDEYESV